MVMRECVALLLQGADSNVVEQAAWQAEIMQLKWLRRRSPRLREGVRTGGLAS